MDIKPFYLKAPFELEASDIPRQFTGVAYSGKSINDWGEQIVIDLDSTTAAPPMPLLLQHDHSSVIGTVAQASIANGSLNVSGELFSDIDNDAALIAKKSKRGACYQMSVGLFDTSREDVPAGKSATVNGNLFNGPLSILRGGNVREVSIVALGADANTSAAFFSQSYTPPGSHTNKEEFMNETEALQNRVSELETALAAKTAEAEAARAELEAQATTARTEELKQLFADCGEELSETTQAALITLTAEQFSVTAESMRKLAAKQTEHNPKLFSQQVTGGAEQQATQKTFSIVDHYALRAKHAQGV